MLPNVRLPPNVLALIREYSKPLTPCNWKQRWWLCVGDIYTEIGKYKNSKCKKYDKYYNLYVRFRSNVQNNYTWWDIYIFYLKNGIALTSNVFNIKVKILYNILTP